MVDNFNKIKSLLAFRTDDDFYFIQIIQRKKDHNDNVNGSNNNSRLIKAYYCKSLEHYCFLEKEIIELCTTFNARAGINLNRRSFKKMALQHLKKVTDQILNEDYFHAHKAYSSVVGAFSHENDKTWILDVDEIGRDKNEVILYAEKECSPFGPKFITTIPSKSGYHILMRPFDLKEFSKKFPDIEVHKNNPTNLYIP